MLNAKSPLPLYHQLADIITERIRSGQYKPGQMIPSEIGLAKHYGIGRPTVRQAMDTLVQKGLIYRKRGAGTFVQKPAETVDLFSLAGTSQAFTTKGIEVEKTIIHPVTLVTLEDQPDNPFNNGRAYFFSRLTRAQGIPVLLEEIFMDADLFRGIDAMDLKTQSLSRTVADQFYLVPENGVQTFQVGRLDKTKARLLDLSQSDPVLTVTRELNFPEAPRAVYSTLFCRTDRFAFSQTIGHSPQTSGD